MLAKTGSPVHINAIEKYISDYYLYIMRPVRSQKTAGNVAIVDSVPAGITLSFLGLVAVYDCGRTSREGVFASGDVVTGAKTVVEAVKVSKRVAEAMDAYIQTKRGKTYAS